MLGTRNAGKPNTQAKPIAKGLTTEGGGERSTALDLRYFCNTQTNEDFVKRLGLIAVLTLTFAGLLTGAAAAVTNFNNAPSGAHYRQGSAEPVCTSSTVPTTGAITVSCTGTQIAGVGNTNADLLLTVEGTANFVCHNPGNENIVEPHSGSVSETTETTLTPSRNGTLVVPAQSVTISPEEAAAQFECPNPNWTEEFVGFSDLSFTYSLTFAGFDQPAILITG